MVDTPAQPRNRLGALLHRSRLWDSVSIFAVLLPAVGLLLAVITGRLDLAGGRAEIFAIGGVAWSLLAIWLVLRARGEGAAAIGLARPTSWSRTLFLALGVAVVAALVGQAAQSLLIALEGQAPDISRFDRVRVSFGAMLANLVSVWISSAIPEEVIWRGFLLTRLAHVLGGGRTAWAGSVVATSVVFGLLHIYQGMAGVVVTGVVGLVFAVAFVTLGRNLWAMILAHGLLHLVSFTALYLGLA